MELTGAGLDEMKEALRLSSGKFPLSTRVITR